MLIDAGSEINAKDNNSRAPLHWASEYHNIDVVKLLLDNGADINMQDNLGETPLHNAPGFAIPGDYERIKSAVEIVRLLLERGADKNIKNKRGETAADVTEAKEIKDIIDSDMSIINR